MLFDKQDPTSFDSSKMASRIDTLISKRRSWDEFVEMANSQAKTKDKGDLFERLTQVYLQTSPTYKSKLKNVYWLSDKTVAGFYLEKF